MQKVQNRKRNEEGATLDASHALILKEALRPHPEIQSMIDANADVLRNGSRQEKFMVLHARVEFDMVRLHLTATGPINYLDTVHIANTWFVVAPVENDTLVNNGVFAFWRWLE